jgi:hypothetical protein
VLVVNKERNIKRRE